MGTPRVTAEVDQCLASYRFWERRFLASPDDAETRENFGRAVATLCRVTGERCGREAAEAAQRSSRALAIEKGDTA
ncbi:MULTISPECIES: DUF5133 domain-containing protein [unclassified Streptomyces]|uniref:DUF5133 domain-containing protein n=1 Tax=unclassified Streptomyces TaxID=2593676 RepID=UPI002E2687E6